MKKIMAHRGARNLWAENSLTGFRNVQKLDVDSVEFDLHLTNAGQILVIHDSTLERTTDAQGHVRELDDETRRAVHLKDEQGVVTDDHIPTFEEVLDVLAAKPQLDLYVELKSGPDGKPYEGLVEKAVEIIKARGIEERVVLHSFDRSVVERCANVAPQIRRLMSLNAEWVERNGGLEHFFTSIEPLVDYVGVHYALFEAEFERITSLFPKERLGVWTLNDRVLIDRWMQRDVAYITSDSPDLVVASRHALAEQPA
ncbi:glycerophosphodiester phosphodiesterase [Brucella pseudogrignonensis]|uniref:glycerophosphodiester phosphodiesterase family protein n=1 Tax=Brucella TaxID=234 RepID=UPI00190CEBCA|nr:MULTISPECIES: glycerophosphodiester phosphodiesterase family protein [Brucella]MBK0019893.1 glycerophosphodiester phosphodiesterase [Ochrobactrum sp. S45]MBK0043367.1 glycerophosphodiester phosphodiesterase [Ochrobactrum sp. S46]UKK92376.1 glycerophosphodiester phosphodiesterase [Brucella pseudogrignonensis]